MTTRERQSRIERKREDAQHELQEARSEQRAVPGYERWRSPSVKRVSGEELPPQAMMMWCARIEGGCKSFVQLLVITYRGNL
jgi:hypothetical protein